MQRKNRKQGKRIPKIVTIPEIGVRPLRRKRRRLRQKKILRRRTGKPISMQILWGRTGKTIPMQILRRRTVIRRRLRVRIRKKRRKKMLWIRKDQQRVNRWRKSRQMT